MGDPDRARTASGITRAPLRRVELLGSAFDWRVKTVDLNDTATQLVGQDPRRVYLSISNPGGGGTVWALPSGQVSTSFGFPVPEVGTLEVWWSKHGPLVMSDWYSLDPSLMMVTLTIAEVFQL